MTEITTELIENAGLVDSRALKALAPHIRWVQALVNQGEVINNWNWNERDRGAHTPVMQKLLSEDIRDHSIANVVDVANAIIEGV